MRPVVLRGSRCVVRPWAAADAASLVRHADNINVARHLRDRFPHPYRPEDARSFLAHAADEASGWINLAIDVEGAAVGGIGLHMGTDIERYSAEVGYWLGEAFWGRGIMTEALTIVTGDAFARLGLLRLYALIFADNAASGRVLQKAGYVREGALNSSCVKYGVPRDQILYARVNPAWRFDAATETRRR